MKRRMMAPKGKGDKMMSEPMKATGKPGPKKPESDMAPMKSRANRMRRLEGKKI